MISWGRHMACFASLLRFPRAGMLVRDLAPNLEGTNSSLAATHSRQNLCICQELQVFLGHNHVGLPSMQIELITSWPPRAFLTRHWLEKSTKHVKPPGLVQPLGPNKKVAMVF